MKDAPLVLVLLFDDFVVPFEIESLLLISAMVGSVMLAKKESSYDESTFESSVSESNDEETLELKETK